MTIRISLLVLLICGTAHVSAQPTPDWDAVRTETLEHFRSLVQKDTSDPPGNEAPAVEYLKQVLEREGIPVEIFALDPQRPNLVARVRGNGKKKPILLMAHTDVVQVDPAKWTHPPFGAVVEGGYVNGRGTVDDKDNVAASLMMLLMAKRLRLPLDRDLIFLAEAGEEGNVKFGIEFMAAKHFDKIDAEYCLAEGGNVLRRGGKDIKALIATAEKVPRRLRLVSRGPAGHGSRPLQNNAIVKLAGAVERIANWMPPMRLNDTTRAYFERLATVSSPEDAARYNGLLNPAKSEEIQRYFAANDPMHYSMLRTSISPTILKGGYRVNVIPSEAEATLDVRAVPDEDFPAFLDEMKKIIRDPQVTIEEIPAYRPVAAPSRLDTEMFRTLEREFKRHYNNAIVLPSMSTGASDKPFLRVRGIESYGIGPLIDEEDGPKGYGAHSDQERILVEELHRFVRFHWDVVVSLAVSR